MTLGTDILTNLAGELAADLIGRAMGRLRDAAFGTAETRALRRAWERALGAMLEVVAAGLGPDSCEPLEEVMRLFVATEGVGDALVDLALEHRELPLELLRARFDALQFDRGTLPVDFDVALSALTRGLAEALLAEAGEPDSPMHNRVNILRVAAIHTLLREQRGTLVGIAESVARLEQRLPEGAMYNLVFLGPVSGVVVGDKATTHLAAGQQDLLGEIQQLLGEMAAARRPPPYTEADRQAYLESITAKCQYIRLPASAGSDRASLPLERVYVALKADRSSPAERRASHDFFQSLVDEQMATHGGDLWQVMRQVARHNPLAARFLRYDPRFAALLAEPRNEGRTFYLAEIIRRHRWIVLLGDPGSGKTTLARWLALQLARAGQEGRTGPVEVPAQHVRPDAEPDQVESLGPARLPVLVRIADYAARRWPRPGEDTRLPLFQYLGRHLEGSLPQGRRVEALHALLRDHLAAGRVAFILDGLDEVTDTAQRRDIAAEIEALIEQQVRDEAGRTPLEPGYHPVLAATEGPLGGGNQVIVTSRIVGYQVHPLPAALPHFVIQPMDDVAVRRFCAAWADAMDLGGWTEALQKAVLEHPNPRVRDEMARNPLLITVLAQVFAGSPGEGLPVRRAVLYESRPSSRSGR